MLKFVYVFLLVSEQNWFENGKVKFSAIGVDINHCMLETNNTILI